MAKSILMSIRPKWVEKILNGEKTIEIRKKFPKDYVGWVYIYMCQDHKRDWYYCKELGCYSKDIHDHNVSFEAFKDLRPLNAKVIARFWCDRVEEITTREDRFKEFMFYETSLDMEDLCKQSCLDYNELDDYLYGENGYAIHITNLEIFEKPKEISEFYKLGFEKEYNQAVFCLKNNVRWKTEPDYVIEDYRLTRAPQSWCYIEI